MPRPSPLISLALATVALAASLPALAQAPASAPPATIPASRGTTLSGAAIVLPDAVKGKVGVLIVGFTRPSQVRLQAWAKKIAVDYPPSAGVVYFEIPVLASAPKLMRGILEGQMKISVTTAEEQSHFLPLLDNEQPWLAVTHYAVPDDAYILLIDGAGVVHWQTEGPITDANFAELKKNIALLKSPPAPMHDNQP
jgi:hypothetical protein